MKKRINTITTLFCTSVLCFTGVAPVIADEMQTKDAATSAYSSEEMKDAKDTVQEAARVVEQLKADQATREVLNRAKAVFIVPTYARASLGVGGAGGEGVLVANNGGNWSGPAFYNTGSINLGLEAGVEAGSLAFLVMSDKAMDGFRQENNFSLNADAGLTIVNFSKRGQISAGKGADVIVWADTKGLYGSLAVSVTDIAWDDEENRAYYQESVDASDIINGTAKEPMPAGPLKSEFSALETGGKSTDAPGVNPPAEQPEGNRY